MRFNLTIKTIGAVIVSSMFAVSCSKTSSVPYVDSSMGFVTGDNLFTTDAGMTYDFTTAEQFDYEFGTRLFVSCEVGDCIDPAKNLFSANLVNCSVPVTGAIVRPGTSGFDKSEWKDPISVNNAWISGGYINLYCSWTGHKNSGVVQRSAFVFEGTSTGIDNAPDTLSFLSSMIPKVMVFFRRRCDQSCDDKQNGHIPCPGISSFRECGHKIVMDMAPV